MHVGIIGAGWIAEKAAITLKDMIDCDAYAIGSRSLEKAEAFARQWNIPKAYGSYSELIADPDVDLVYVATPHSHHYDVTRQALLAGKQRRVFLAEAIWTRYQPCVAIVRQLIAEGRIGQPRLITATLGYSMGRKERIFRPDLCGGALLDLGVYALNFVRMFADAPVKSIDGHSVKTDTGMDLTNAITLILEDGLLANVQSSAACVGDNIGVIASSSTTSTIRRPLPSMVPIAPLSRPSVCRSRLQVTNTSSLPVVKPCRMACWNPARCLIRKRSTSCSSWTTCVLSGACATRWTN